MVNENQKTGLVNLVKETNGGALIPMFGMGSAVRTFGRWEREGRYSGRSWGSELDDLAYGLYNAVTTASIVYTLVEKFM